MLLFSRKPFLSFSMAAGRQFTSGARGSSWAVYVGAAVLALGLACAGSARADNSSSDSQVLTLTLPAGGADTTAGPSDGGASVPSDSAPIPAPGQEIGQAAAPNTGFDQLPAPDFNHLSVIAVGIVNEDGAQIVRRAGPASMTVLFTCARGQTVGVVGQLGQWYCVEMADQSLGCILTNRVALTSQRPGPVPDIPNGPQTPSVRLRATPSVLFPDSIRDNASTPAGRRVVENAMRYLGVRYRWGGNTAAGIDCSGLVKAAFAQEGVDLPRTAREQAEVGMPVSLSDIQAGDRLSFICHGSTVDHTGIYIGGGQFLQASGAKHEVCITPLSSYLKYLVGIHRDFR